jgi:hypothetical protein
VRDFKDAEVWDLGRVRRLDVLLEALEAGMPADAIVYVESASFADDILAALAALPAIPKDQRRTDLQGTLWPSPTSFHLPVRTGVLGLLRELERRHAEPEVCEHVAVYRGEEILALAYDAGGGALLVGRTLSPEAVEKMRRIIDPNSAAQGPPRARLVERIQRMLRRSR